MSVKQIIVEFISDKVNLVNLSFLTAAVYGEILLMIDFVSIGEGIKLLLGIAAGGFLMAYNALKFYNEWREKRNNK